jgi:hypothetical protein
VAVSTSGNVYEVNPSLWQFGRGKPRLEGLTVEQTTVGQAIEGEFEANERDARKSVGQRPITELDTN